MPHEFERVKEALGEAKAIKLQQLRIKTEALTQMLRYSDVEGVRALEGLRQETNEILAEAGLVSNR